MFKKIMKDFKKGFTLVELLVVIAVLGVLAAGLIVAINPADKIRVANDSTVQSHVGSIATAAVNFATANQGGYPLTLNELAPAEISVIPTAPVGTSAAGVAYITPYGWASNNGVAGVCTTAAHNCTNIRIWNMQTSLAHAATTVYMFCSRTGHAGLTTGTTDALCP